MPLSEASTEIGRDMRIGIMSEIVETAKGTLRSKGSRLLQTLIDSGAQEEDRTKISLLRLLLLEALEARGI